MQISELARRAGVSAHAIRHYESLGLIASRRRPSGYREFDEGVIRELRFIAMSRHCGFSLKHIAEILPAYRSQTLGTDRMIALLQQRMAEVDELIARQQALRNQLSQHIAWLHERAPASARPQAAHGKPGFPRVRAPQARNPKGRENDPSQ
ncbi:MerR family transcriptional regulator [Comamonas composti]|uniref:MerR family transcriptional regulator n=1 Tax=Comamonas composti TaxID=408558 RepID=UPI00040C700C|nr:MerR family transcriptional regulator [Comamonas composti]